MSALKRQRTSRPHARASLVTCPLCGRVLPSSRINSHVDACLPSASTAPIGASGGALDTDAHGLPHADDPLDTSTDAEQPRASEATAWCAAADSRDAEQRDRATCAVADPTVTEPHAAADPLNDGGDGGLGIGRSRNAATAPSALAQLRAPGGARLVGGARLSDAEFAIQCPAALVVRRVLPAALADELLREMLAAAPRWDAATWWVAGRASVAMRRSRSFALSAEEGEGAPAPAARAADSEDGDGAEDGGDDGGGEDGGGGDGTDRSVAARRRRRRPSPPSRALRDAAARVCAVVAARCRQGGGPWTPTYALANAYADEHDKVPGGGLAPAAGGAGRSIGARPWSAMAPSSRESFGAVPLSSLEFAGPRRIIVVHGPSLQHRSPPSLSPTATRLRRPMPVGTAIGRQVGLHTDDLSKLGPRPLVAALSLGATRPFHLKRRAPADREGAGGGGGGGPAGERAADEDRGGGGGGGGRALFEVPLPHNSLLILRPGGRCVVSTLLRHKGVVSSPLIFCFVCGLEPLLPHIARGWATDLSLCRQARWRTGSTACPPARPRG